MKKLLLLLSVTFFLQLSLSAQNEAKAVLTATADEPLVEWVDKMDRHDFGQIAQGTPVKTVFTFKNLTSEPLLIDNVRTTCGCTAPDWTKDAILPGAESEIEVSYNAAKEGKFNKAIKVYLKGQKQPEILVIEGEVLKKNSK